MVTLSVQECVAGYRDRATMFDCDMVSYFLNYFVTGHILND